MGRNSNSFVRHGRGLKPAPAVLIVCEDTHSSKIYLEEATQTLRANAKVLVAHSGNTDPLGIVSFAVKKTRAFEKIYCVIDRDEHKNFDEALALANQHPSISMCVSYPCFEYWPLLHHRKTRKPYSRAGNKSPADCLMDDLKQIDQFKNYGKGRVAGLFNQLYENHEAANLNAEWALIEAQKDGELNPSTRIHELIEYLDELGKI
jgi:RloB-like protein